MTSWNSGAVDLWGLRGDEAIGQPFFSLDFGLPTDSLRAVVNECLDTGRRDTPRYVSAVSRLGKSLRCAVLTSPFDGDGGGVVMLMEESSGDSSARS